MSNPDPLSPPPSFGIDPKTLIPSHTGGLLELPIGFDDRLRGTGHPVSGRSRATALQMVQAIAASDVPVRPLGPAAHLLELAGAAIYGDGRARYEGCRLSLEEEIILAGLYGLDGDPAEATVLLGAAHLLAPDPLTALGVAYGMVAVRRERYGPLGLDAGCSQASSTFARMLA